MATADWRIPESDLYLFNHGEAVRAWQHLGAHAVPAGGYRFAVWAPNAKAISAVGDFNDWDVAAHPLAVRGSTGVWEGLVPTATAGQRYKFELTDAQGKRRLKADPFGRRTELRPKTGSVLAGPTEHAWQDDAWLAARASTQRLDRPLRTYEAHLGSWRRHRTYRELARDLVGYVRDMGFTHVEFLPLAEFPYDGSWGYQVCGYYAPTSRFGSPDDLRFLIDAFHAAGIGVLLDWVPAHFPRDEHGLYRFDGSHLFEHEDPRRGVHKEWDTLIFNYERSEVRNFLVSNALYWVEEFHIDGLRVDAVASMLYRDYARDDGEWVPDEDGGNQDKEAIAFLRELNERVHAEAPGVLMIAEESTAFAGVTQPVAEGGLGFDLKWNMGWMHDSLDYLEQDPVHRRHHQERLTFALYYAFKEQFLSPLSHDEVVHLKKSLLSKMPGDAWQQRANLRLLHAWQLAHPGKTLLFMGGEFGQQGEWNHDAELEWHLLDSPDHAGLRLLVGDCNRLGTGYPALYELDGDWTGFEWMDFSDAARSVIAFVRWSADKQQGVLFVFNFTPVVRHAYRVGVPRPGRYVELLNTDAACYGGSDVGNLGELATSARPTQDQDYSLELTLPPLAAIALQLPHELHRENAVRHKAKMPLASPFPGGRAGSAGCAP